MAMRSAWDWENFSFVSATRSRSAKAMPSCVSATQSGMELASILSPGVSDVSALESAWETPQKTF
jgi:hypothetical protein